MFFFHRVVNAVTMMYHEADEKTACFFIRPSTYFKHPAEEQSEKLIPNESAAEDPDDEETLPLSSNDLSQPQ